MKLLKSLPILCFCFSASAEDVDFLELSLSELLEVEIYTASQETEKRAASPSITSVITAKQLKQWGVNNLYEALSFLPGIELNESYMGYTVLTFRGVTPGLYNNKALFMINGQPVFERLFGSSHFEYLPIEMVERIEVVRSPASALYGSNAVSGVVNVITKQEDNQVNVKAGSNNQKYVSVMHHEETFSISASSLRDDGYAYTGTNDELGNPVDFDFNNAINNIFIDYHPEGWRINAAYFEMEKSKFGLNPIVFHHGDNRQTGLNLSINRYQPLGNGTINFWLRYDSMDKELDAEAFPFPSSNPVTNFNTVDRTSAEIQYKEAINNTTSYIVGSSIEIDKSGPMIFVDQVNNSIAPFSPFTEDQEFTNYAIYAQLKHSFTDSLTTVIGLRSENNSDSDNSGIIPRIGMTYEYLSDHYFKLLYSEAFRAPVFLEKYANVPSILLGDTDLNREKIKTIEMAFDSKINDSNTILITSYWLQLTDEITRRPAATTGTEYYNAPGREMYGLESEWKSILSNKTTLDINASYLDGEEDIYNSAPFVASYTINIMLNYKLNKSFDFSLTNQTISSKEYILTDNSEGEIDGYNLTNIVINYQQKSYDIRLTFRNIFDEEYTYPEPVRRNIAEIPGGDGASAYLNFTYKY